MRYGKKIWDEHRDGSRISGWLKWIGMTWMTGVGDLFPRQLLHYMSLLGWDGWGTSCWSICPSPSSTTVSGQSDFFFYGGLCWFKSTWARQKLYGFLYLHHRNYIVLPSLYHISQKSHPDWGLGHKGSTSWWEDGYRICGHSLRVLMWNIYLRSSYMHCIKVK